MYNFPLNDITYQNDKNALLKENVRECMNVLHDNGITMKRSEIKKLDTIDFSVYAVGNDEGNPAALPSMKRTDDECAAIFEQWFLIIPPLSSGVLRMNTARYLKYDVSDLNLDAKKYTVRIEDYGYESDVWMLNRFVSAEVHYKDDGTINFVIDNIPFADLADAAFLKNALETGTPLDSQMVKTLKDVTLPTLKGIDNEDDGYDVINHFLAAIEKVNFELMSGQKPKAVRGSAPSKVKAVAGDLEKAPKPQIVRTLKSGVNIKSVKVPKAPTIESIRHYKLAAWNVRGFVRHNKNGTITYIKPSVRERKCLKDKGNVQPPQTIVIAGTKQ